MFQVTISYIEQDLTMAEAERYAADKFGSTALVSFAPVSSNEKDIIDFMLQCLVTQRQTEARFSNHTELYSKKLASIKSAIIEQVSSKLDEVVKRNEEKL